MIISIDTETLKKNEEGIWEYCLDGTGKHVKMVCTLSDSGVKKSFNKPEEAWNYIIKKGESEQKRGKRLTCYMHNSKYDFYNIANLNDKGIRWFSENPFICGYYKKIERTLNDEEYRKWMIYARKEHIWYKLEAEGLGFHTISYNKEIIRFLDTLSIYRMSLEKMGEMIGYAKINMPKDERFGSWLNDNTMKKMEKYCMNDCLIVIEGIKKIKEKLKEEGINLKNICTINQVAISYLMNRIRKHPRHAHILQEQGEYIIKSKYADEIHKAYRAGLVRVWKTGEFEDLTDIDCNSLFPYATTIMKFPDLRTERKIKEPLKIYQQEVLFNKIGFSKCMLYNENNKLGLIPIRTGKRSHVPLIGKYIIGTWTHTELAEAIKEGYKVIDIEWSIIYEEGYNTLGEIFKEVYQRRKQDNDKFNNYFYKCVLNSGIGKFGQRKTNQEIFIDSVEMVQEYLKKNIQVIKGIEGKTDLMFSNRNNNYEKKYYNPVISSLITAQARVYMYQQYKKVPLENLVYSDTDSIITRGDFRRLYNIGEEMGEFKVERDSETNEELVNTKGIIWGTKSKRIGNNIGVSGAFKNELNKEDFDKGEITVRKMNGIKAGKGKEVGKFEESKRDLKKQKEDLEEIEWMLEKQDVFIDDTETDIQYFSRKIDEVLNKDGIMLDM